MPARRRLLLWLLPLFTASIPLSSPAQGINGSIQAQAQAAGPGIASWYAARGNAPTWSGESLGSLARFVQELDTHGLNPALFGLAQWDAQWRNPSTDPATRAKVEVGTTQLALFAIQSLAYGFVDPTTVHTKWDALKRTPTAFQFLDQALAQPPSELTRFLLNAVPPQDDRYRDMVKTLARYRELDRLGGWKTLPATATPVGPGSRYDGLDLLRTRLQAEGDLPPGLSKFKGKELDQRTSDAIKSFQFRHGIEPDGYIGGDTLKEFNIPTSQRVKMLIINLDRLRWMPRAYEEAEHIEVNIAESALRLFNNQRQVTVMKVIVGVKGKHQTPIFHGNVQHLIFRPYWNIPMSIAKTELVPLALQDPEGYMRQHNYEIVTGYENAPNDILPNTIENLNKCSTGALLMRQRSGSDNSLGLVKFIFPNDNSVYLHDTPDHSLFERANRDFSHGCVRVSRPDELATLLLQRSGGPWDINNVRTAMNDVANPNRKEVFSKTLPVYLMYWTSTIMSDGRVRFDEDIYGHDVVMFQKFGL